MATSRSIFNRRRRRSTHKPFELQLTSFLDILVILLVFLLKSYTTSTHNFTSQKGLQLPYSKSEDVPPDSVHVIISKEGLIFENEKIVAFQAPDFGSAEAPVVAAQDLDASGKKILPLYDALVKAREKSEVNKLKVQGTAADEKGTSKFNGTIAVQADKVISYELIRKVLYTSGSAGYSTFRFLALKNEK